MKKKILLNLLVVFLSLFLLNTFSLRAEGELVTNLEGVSIRKKTDDYSQGLRFYGKLDESVKGNAHGFYLVYGKTTLSELTEKLDSGANPIYINGKEVYHIEIPGSTEENNFSVVLVGIPEDGYFDLISVIPYVVVNGVKVFPPEVNKRCVADVALKMANAGEEVADIVRFDSIVNTNKKKVSMSPNGDVIISSGVHELNILKLRREFIKDWNYTFNKTLTELNHEEFFNEAKEGSPDTDVNNNDLSNTNLYKFFNNHRFSNKWRWLLNYMVNECDIYFASLQANAILGNGLGNNLFNGAHLAYSLVNFFNQSNEKGLYNAIDFTDLSRYDRVKNYNDGVYVDMREYELYDEGGEFNLPAPLNKPGYNFKHYKKGGVEYNPNAYYQVTNNEEKFEAIYSPIEYPLSFYDGAMKINELNRTYNVEDEISLPVYEKAGYNFVGWYDNSNLFGSPITNIEKGRTGALNLYGKWSEEIIEYVYNINYELNGGHFPGAYPTQYSMNEETLLPVPVRSGYQFAGWYNNSELTGDAITKITIGSVFDKTFYAKWTAIGQTDAEKLNDAKTALNIGLQSGDTLASITGNVTLPTTGMHDAVITWATSNSGAITTAGVVTRGASDVTVTLTATIKVNLEQETKTFTLLVKKIDAATEYTITYHLNGGAWPTSGGTGGYTNRDVMITDFLTEFHGYLTGKGVITMSASDFMHGAGKTSGFDGSYNNHMADLRAINDKTINPEGGFVNQAQYNKWVPLIDLMDEFVGKVNPEQAGEFWSSDYTANLRMKQFVMKTPIGQVQAGDEIYTRIPTALQSGGGGTPITPPSKYTPADNDITLPVPVKDGDPFIGWYDNANLYGTAITKIVKGSSGNKVFYARYNSSTVVAPPLSDSEKLTEAKAALNVGYASGDSASSVTKNVTLPSTGLHSVTVTWATSDATTITTGGVVTRKESGNITVTLTATLKIGSLTETKQFTLTVKKLEPEPTSYTITFNLNGGQFVTSGYANKSQLATAFLTDLYAFVNPSENLTTFMHGAGKTSGFDGLWFSNETYRGKIYGANIKTGNNNYFLSHSNYQAKWAPLANFMVNFVKKGNPDQDFWSSPYTGCLRMKQYFTNVKPGGAWSDEDMAAMPTGLSATQIPNEYNADSPAITLPTATRSGYEFKGWYETANFSGTPVTSIPAGSSGNKVYYAKWDQPSSFTITYNLNGGAFAGYTNKATLATDFLTDLYNFVSPSENLTSFMHGVGKTSGFDGLWYSNEEYRAKIYAANTKSGNNNYFLSHSTYGPKWKPFANFMVNFVKVGNPDQDFWASPYTGNLRINQYFRNIKPGSAWTDADMAALPTGLAASVPYEYSVNSPTITLPTPTRSGYTFDGWYTAATGGTKVTSIPQGSTGNKTFYARWSIVDISINRTRTLTGTDLWNMRDSVNNVSLVSGSIRLTNTGATGAINTRPMTITKFYQLVMSWNVSNLGNAEVQFMVSIGTGSSMSKWFTMGYWKTGNHRSSSATSDTFASLSVDTLTNKNVSGNTKVKFRIVITPNGSAPRIDSVSVTTKPTSSTGVSPSTSGLAYKVLNVPRIAQMSIPNIGSVICSPTSMAMILNYYGKGVTAAGVAGVVYDRTWKAYGNWTLNASYAGHFGLYSRVEFVSSMSVIRDYINRGIPVAVSVNCSYKIAGNPGSPQAYPSGHLLVVVGFESINGVWHAVVNDPAVSSANNVRRKYTVASLSSAMVGFTYIVSSSPL